MADAASKGRDSRLQKDESKEPDHIGSVEIIPITEEAWFRIPLPYMASWSCDLRYKACL